MTGYGSLFERLNGDTEVRSGLTREASAVASVAAHLAKMLCTRAGSAQTAADYGLPDLNDMRLSLHDARGQACRAIQASIEAYEPRLRNVCVVSAPNDADQLRLSFRIDAFLEVGGVRGAVNFSACLDGNGQIKVIQG